MYAETSLEIRGYHGGSIPNSFLRQLNETDRLGIFFPGYGYSNQAPVLHFLCQLCLDRGFDVLQVDYEYNRDPGYRVLPQTEQFRRLYLDAEGALQAGLSQREYRQVSFIGKSLGTFAMGYLTDRNRENLSPECIWLTPILDSEVLYTQIQRSRPRSLFVVGTQDTYYQPDRLAELVRMTNGESLVIEEVNHGLEVSGSVKRSIQALEKIVTSVEVFIAG